MKTNIDYISQIDGRNHITVFYKGGARRTIYFNGICYPFTKTQKDFLDKAIEVRLEYEWFDFMDVDGCTYWVIDPEHWVFAQKKLRDERREKNAKQSIA